MTLTKDQLEDSPELLERMLKDNDEAKPIYQPSHVWNQVKEILTGFLRKNGLKDIRSRTDCAPMQGFGATDPSPRHYPLAILANTNIDSRYRDALIDAHEVFHQNPSYQGLPFGISVLELCESAFRIAELSGRLHGATPLDTMEISMIGTPAFTFLIRGKNYTNIFLSYYMRYAYCCQFIDFSKVDTVVEIGCGAGKFAEVLKKAHPHLGFYLLELAPQSYICHQYLRGVFGEDAVIHYDDLRNSKHIEVPQGKIAVLGNWQVEDIKPQGRVLFVNTASFQEMEPDIVKNYIDYVKPYSQAIYLLQSITGVPGQQAHPTGANEPLTMEHYQNFLSDRYKLISQEIAYDPLKTISDLAHNYYNMMWVNQQRCEFLRHS